MEIKGGFEKQLVSFFFILEGLIVSTGSVTFFLSRNESVRYIRVITSSCSYRNCSICVALVNALETFSCHTNWGVCDFFLFHLLWSSTDLIRKCHRQQINNDLSSYTEEMQSPQLKEVYFCITLMSKILSTLKPNCCVGFFLEL